MRFLKNPLVIIGAVIVLLLLFWVTTYNSLVAKSQQVDNQWAQVETQYQRRFDLIPNLVNAVKGIFTQEQKVFDDIAKARTQYSGAQSVDQKAQAASQVESALSRLLVIVENYPQLKSSENVTQLMDELAGTENRISVERKRYNDEVRDYNTAIKTLPTNIVAGMSGFRERNYFQAASEAQQAPQVNLNP